MADIQLADGYSPLDDGEWEQAVEYLFAHNMSSVQDLLRAAQLPVSGKKETLRERVTDAIGDGTIDPTDVVSQLDKIEGWGNQHVYLYQAPQGELKVWRTEKEARKRLKQIGEEGLFNRRRPLVLPDDPTLSSVEWSKDRVRFIWIDKRDWQLRRDDEDFQDDGLIYKAYQDNEARGVTSFDWNLTTGQAALMIQRLPSGERYGEIRESYEQAIEQAVQIKNFEQVKIRKAIRKIERSKEVLNRQVAHETKKGGRASFTSRDRRTDAFADPDLDKSRKALGRTSSVLGNFYWLEKKNQLTRKIHVKLYASDQRVGIFGECTESEVKYVLSRIRHHSR